MLLYNHELDYKGTKKNMIKSDHIISIRSTFPPMLHANGLNHNICWGKPYSLHSQLVVIVKYKHSQENQFSINPENCITHCAALPKDTHYTSMHRTCISLHAYLPPLQLVDSIANSRSINNCDSIHISEGGSTEEGTHVLSYHLIQSTTHRSNG